MLRFAYRALSLYQDLPSRSFIVRHAMSNEENALADNTVDVREWI